MSSLTSVETFSMGSMGRQMAAKTAVKLSGFRPKLGLYQLVIVAGFRSQISCPTLGEVNPLNQPVSEEHFVRGVETDGWQ